MRFEEKLNLYVKKIEENIDTILQEKDNYQKNIYKAMRYSMLAGGKRIRPAILLACADILDVEEEVVMPFACAIEMIHTYSLIHDDLPALDNDDLRRGRKTCHKQFDEATAILAGDALLNKAFEVMSNSAEKMAHPLRGIKMIKAVASMSGTEGMIGGQVIDLETEGKKVDKSVIETMYRLKTGCLLKSPVLVAIEAKDCRDSKTAEILIKYIEIIGLAFQIKDDILDEIGDPEKLGKATGRDVKENKTTYVSIHGLEYCKKLLDDLTNEAVAYAEMLGEKGIFLKDLAIFLLKRDN